MQCKTPVCSQVLQYSCMQGSKLGGVFPSNGIRESPLLNLPLGWTVWGVQGDRGATSFTTCRSTCIYIKQQLNSCIVISPKQEAFLQFPRYRSCSSLLEDPCLALVRSIACMCVFACTSPSAPCRQRLVQHSFEEKPRVQKLTLPCWCRKHWLNSQN